MQYAEVARPQYTPNVRHAISAGIASGCPFCRGRTSDLPPPGSRVLMLAGFRTGWVGTVAAKDTWLGGDEFCVHFDHDPPRALQRVLLRHHQFVTGSLSDPPRWLAPLATDDLAFVDEFVVRLCGALFRDGSWRWQQDELFPPIFMSWRRRLPICANDIWQTCAAHGMLQRLKTPFLQSFDFGFKLLITCQGRPPIKRRRAPAMSLPQYAPSRRNADASPR